MANEIRFGYYFTNRTIEADILEPAGSIRETVTLSEPT